MQYSDFSDYFSGVLSCIIFQTILADICIFFILWQLINFIFLNTKYSGREIYFFLLRDYLFRSLGVTWHAFCKKPGG